MKNHINIIVDNGGGVTLQISQKRGVVTRRWQHSYPEGNQQLVDDILAAESGDNPWSGWDGNDLTEGVPWIEVSYDDIRNGSYREYTPAEIRVIEPGDTWGRNVGQVARLLNPAAWQEVEA